MWIDVALIAEHQVKGLPWATIYSTIIWERCACKQWTIGEEAFIVMLHTRRTWHTESPFEIAKKMREAAAVEKS